MANIFRLIATYYASKWGSASDSNNGTTPELARATVAGLKALLASVTVATDAAIGTGTYKETLSVASTGTASALKKITALGKVIFRAVTSSSIFTTTSGVWQYIGIELQGYANYGNTGTNSTSNRSTFTTCIIRTCTANAGTGHTYTNTEFYGCTIAATNASYTGCKFLENTTIPGTATTLDKCIVDSTSKVTVANTVTGTNNIIQGQIRLTGGTYASWETFAAANPTLLLGSVNVDPLFRSPTHGVYAVSKLSPAIALGAGNVQVGSFTPIDTASSTNALSPLNPNVVITGATHSGNTLAVNSDGGNLVADRIADWIPLDEDNPGRIFELSGGIDPVGNLEFNKSLPPPHNENMNVPDASLGFGAVDGSDNPDRLTIFMMFSSSTSKPTSDSQGDNNGYWATGTYKPFYYFGPAQVHRHPTTGVIKTNGEVDFPWTDTANIFNMASRWGKSKEAFRNNYKN